MKRETYGCACCNPAFAQMFHDNQIIANLPKPSPTSEIAGADWLSHVTRRDFVKAGAALAGTTSIWPTDIAAQGIATTVFTNGTILTVDRAFSEADAIAIRGKKILAVGSDSDVREAAGATAKIVDLGGRTVLPGFIDAHTHVVTGSVVDSIMEYVGVARFAKTSEVLDHLRQRAGERAPGEWIAARNFDPSIQEGPEALTFADLDSVSKDHPVFVLNASGHLAYANSKAFSAAGIPKDIADPPGAEFVRDNHGDLTGTMKNMVSFLQVLKANPALATTNPVEALPNLLNKWSALGLTTVSELSLGALSQSASDINILWETAKSGRLNARIRAYPFYPFDDDWTAAETSPGEGNELVRIAGYKLVADGSNQGFTGLQREPYLGTDSSGIAYTAPDDLKELALRRAAEGWQLAIHGNGDKGIDNVLDALEAVRDAGHDMNKVRGRIEHCSILHDDQIARMKELGVSASFLIGHVYFWGIAMRDTVFGEAKAKLLDRCKSCEEAGVGFSLHSDFMVTDPDPLHMIEMAVTRSTWKEPDYILAPDERISVESAIRAVTSEAAWQLFSEHEIGSLEEGKLADFVILEKDPRKVEPTKIKDIKVLETWMDGRQVFAA